MTSTQSFGQNLFSDNVHVQRRMGNVVCLGSHVYTYCCVTLEEEERGFGQPAASAKEGEWVWPYYPVGRIL